MFFTALVLRPRRDELGNQLEIGVFSAESEFSSSILGKQCPQQRETNASGYELTHHLARRSVIQVNLRALLSVKMAKKWKWFDESD